MNQFENANLANSIAIVGMAGEFPGADSVEAFWQNLVAGTCSIEPISADEITPDPFKKIDPTAKNFVPVAARLRSVEEFDADFFDFSAREAEVMDPQHRRFLMCAWRALEDAAIDTERFAGAIGVVAGGTMSRYLMNCLSHQEIVDAIGFDAMGIGNNLDFLPTMLSYKLNLQGPSYSVQTACSTSLVAVHLACQMLLNHEAELALAGAVCVTVPQDSGYLYQEGGIVSPDGVCRTFDQAANGTVFGNGVGVVVLQRLEDAIAQKHNIHAVILGSAVNNDGHQKVGFTAPSVDGQSRAIVESLAVSGVTADTITLVEAHGTGTRMGDPIEVAALTNAFRNDCAAKQYCALSSVKPNVGHLDAAAGMAGLIKTVMSLKHQVLPPSIHVDKVNPDLKIEDTPFYINRELAPWPSPEGPRRAGVSSLGIGGTNAHIIVEEWCDSPRSALDQQANDVVLPLSAKTEPTLSALRKTLADYLSKHPEICAADVAFTFAVGRRFFEHRQALTLPANLCGEALAQRIMANEQPETSAGQKDIGVLWQQGAVVDWQGYYQALDCRRVSVPGYPLAQNRYWLDYRFPENGATTLVTRQVETADWFWQHSWRRQLITASQTAADALPWLIFVQEGEASEWLADGIEQRGQPLIRVYAGDTFSQQSAKRYVVAVEEPASYLQLIEHLSVSEGVSHILHGWLFSSKPVSSQHALAQGFYSGLSLLKALAAKTTGQQQVWWITDSVFQVLGHETPVPYSALINGLNRVVTQESGRLICRQLDLCSGDDIALAVPAIINEVNRQSNETLIAFRAGQRWVFAAEPLPLAPVSASQTQAGVYIITGGLGQFGLATASYFIERDPQARVILTSRADVGLYHGQRAAQGDIETTRLAALEALWRKGAQVDVVQTDAGDEHQVNALLEQTIARYGKVTGLVHAAGLIGEQTHISFIESDREHCERIFRAKVQGTQILIDALKDIPIQFVMFVSSLSPLLGGLGLTAYAAANSFMDSCATRLNRESQDKHWVSVNWEGWIRQGGVSADYDELGKTFQQLSLSDTEIRLCFERILAHPALSNVVVSTGSLTERLQRWSTIAGMAEITGTIDESLTLGTRRDDKATVILDMARQLLGNPALGPDDDLFKFGADSLTAIQLIARIRDLFKVDLPMQTLFDRPTVTSLVCSISAKDEDDELADLVAELEAMDDEEVRKLSQQIKDGKPSRWIEI
ncbi:SDR family NAD(P)-dependent oxidoreductase [Musicola paradisiaca]|uniref:6-deoxyerythronolide-B synthase n=1 Tax=Musicola paradisiaca (strain Ech703) TaxID=579405 RepID=C6CCJ8_MUSP7|nr:SDR family NAD(P)-dependent oxidoreductase [Musicola paradisiaca]ACS86841.1 6-deoxyerythronolide-B synthase [Musicola paradisiaca Ech703]